MASTNSRFNQAIARSCFDKAQHERVCFARLSVPFALSVARAKSKGEWRHL